MSGGAVELERAGWAWTIWTMVKRENGLKASRRAASAFGTHGTYSKVIHEKIRRDKGCI